MPDTGCWMPLAFQLPGFPTSQLQVLVAGCGGIRLRIAECGLKWAWGILDCGLQNSARPGAIVSIKMSVRGIYTKHLDKVKLCKIGLGQGLRIEWIKGTAQRVWGKGQRARRTANGARYTANGARYTG